MKKMLHRCDARSPPNEGANPWNASQPACSLVPFCLSCEISIECRDPLIKRLPPRQHIANEEADTCAQLLSTLSKKLGHPEPQFGAALRHDNSTLEQNST
jgi:hypothetical protein